MSDKFQPDSVVMDDFTKSIAWLIAKTTAENYEKDQQEKLPTKFAVAIEYAELPIGIIVEIIARITYTKFTLFGRSTYQPMIGIPTNWTDHMIACTVSKLTLGGVPPPSIYSIYKRSITRIIKFNLTIPKFEAIKLQDQTSVEATHNVTDEYELSTTSDGY